MASDIKHGDLSSREDTTVKELKDILIEVGKNVRKTRDERVDPRELKKKR